MNISDTSFQLIAQFYIENGYILLVILCASVIMVHLFAFLFRKRLTRRFWKCGDYVWIGLIVISLPSTLAGLRLVAADPSINQLRTEIDETHSVFPINLNGDDWIYDSSQRFLSRAMVFKRGYPDAVDKDFQSVLDLIDSLGLADQPTQNLKEAYAFWNAKRNILKSGIDRLEHRNRLNQQLFEIEAKAKRKWWEWLLIFIGPFALAIAGGIRLTVTSVELFGWYKTK